MTANLESLADLFEAPPQVRPAVQHVLASAAAQAGGDAAENWHDPAARLASATIFLGEALTHLWLERDWRRDAVEDLLATVAQRLEIPVAPLARGVAMHVLRDPTLLQLPPTLAIEAQLRRLTALTPARAASMWVVAEGEVRCVATAGRTREPDAERDAAAKVLETRHAPGPREAQSTASTRPRWTAAPVIRWQQPQAAVVVALDPDHIGTFRPVLASAATVLGPILEREALLRRGASTERALVESSERRLERLALDLHDRPVQDVRVLVDDVRLFKRQVTQALDGHRHSAVIAGRVDDLEARLTALHEELRHLSHSLTAPTVLRRPLVELLHQQAAMFRDRTEIALELHASGDLDAVPNAQRVTVLRIVEEALNNAREHSGASTVSVSVIARREHLEARVTDDGRGFDVEQTLTSAAARGRLGLVGISERARVVGGTCRIRSCVGGNTEIQVALPRADIAVEAGAAPLEARR